MLLAVDIGNTNISLGIFRGSRLVKRYKIPTKSTSYAGYLKKIFAGNSISQAVACSVVPQASKLLGRQLERFLGKRPYYIGKDIKVPLKNLYRRPEQLGLDRLVNAYAAVRLYGAPVIVIDFGTAITFDVISRKCEYLGGMILPGLQLSLDALHRRTALLPSLILEKPKEFIGRDTKNSILSGVVYGFAALSDALANRIKQEIGRQAKIIGTGGNIALMAKFCRRLDAIDPGLTLKGLNMLRISCKKLANCH